MSDALAQVYCLKCMAWREVLNTWQTTTRNGRVVLRGTCATCSMPVARMARKEVRAT